MILSPFSMETSVLIHVRVQKMLQQFLSQCQWGQAVTHGVFFLPSFSSILNRSSLFFYEWSLCEGNSCSGRAMRIHKTGFSKASYNYSCMYRSPTLVMYLGTSLFVFWSTEAKISAGAAFAACAPVNGWLWGKKQQCSWWHLKALSTFCVYFHVLYCYLYFQLMQHPMG